MSTRERFTNDGFGINGPDEFRSRVVTFSKGAGAEFVPELVARLAAYDKLVAVLSTMLGAAETDCLDDQSNVWRSAMIDARDALGL